MYWRSPSGDPYFWLDKLAGMVQPPASQRKCSRSLGHGYVRVGRGGLTGQGMTVSAELRYPLGMDRRDGGARAAEIERSRMAAQALRADETSRWDKLMAVLRDLGFRILVWES